MTKRLLVVLALIIAVLAVSVNARVVPKDNDTRLNNIKVYTPVTTTAPVDDGSVQGDLGSSRGGRTQSLGVAQPSLASRGHQVTTSYRDYSYNSTNPGQLLAVNPVGNTFGTAVQFTYIYKASGATADRARWGYAAYDAVAGVFKAATEIVQDNDPGSNEAGSYPRIVINPETGKAIIGSYDFPDALNNANGAQLHVTFDASALGGLFGTIGDGQRIPDSIEMKQNYEPTSLNCIWPALGMTTAPGDTVLYLSAVENNPTLGALGSLKVYRRDGSVAPTTAAANPDNNWVLVYKDTTMYPNATLVCQTNGNKVALAWTLYTADGFIQGNEHMCDIYYADSPHGLAGTWTRHNVTNYGTTGYNAVLEVNALYDTGGKLHLVWPTCTIDNGTTASLEGRIFHWSEYNAGTIYTVYSYENPLWDSVQCSMTGGFSQLTRDVQIGECDGRLYTIFSGTNDPNLENTFDDCAVTAAGAANYRGNAEIYVTISKDLQGKSWDKPRNLTASYTPNCDTLGGCACDRWGAISARGIDDNVQPGDWTAAADAKYDLGTGYSGTNFTHVWYTQDHCPGPKSLAAANGMWTENDLRWIRLACVQPVTAAILAVSPASVGFPTFTHPSTAKNIPLTLENTGNATLTFSSIAKFEDSCKGPGCGPSGWLNVSGAPATINEATTITSAALVLNNAGVITSGPTRLWGRVVWNYGSPAASFTQPVSFVVADTIMGFLYDSISTNCAIKLVVGNNGNMGNNYAGNLNMNFRPPVECDTGSAAPYVSRGDASIYLGDASPVIVRKVGTNPARASWSIFSQGYENDNGFKPLALPAPVKVDTSVYQRYFSGEFLTVDSLVKVRKTWYAPKTSVDTCNFIIEKMQVTPNPAGTAVTNLLIGEAFDWDLPSDSGNGTNAGGSGNVTGFELARRLVWARGFNSADTTVDCWNNSLRYGGSALLNMAMKANNNCTSVQDTLLYGGYSAANDTFVYPASGFVPERTWLQMKNPGYVVEPRTTDIHVVLTYKGGATGYTLPANDTLTIYTAMAVTRSAATTNAGLDSLKKYIDKARKWSDWYVRKCTVLNCCTGTTGNVNMAGGVDLADLSALVSYLTGGGYVLTCTNEANVNHAGGVDLADLSALVSYLTGGGYVLPAC